MLCWTDSMEISILLDENFPNIDPKTISFVKLRELVLALEEFEEGQTQCGERILEAIQMQWMQEK